MDRQTMFLLLVQTAALERSLKINDPSHDYAAPTLAKAMRIDPECLPEDLDRACFDIIEWILCGQPQPEWVQLQPGAPE